LRTLLIHGARAVIRVAERKAGYADSWLAKLRGRRHQNAAAVALAKKNARIVWALLTQDREYQAISDWRHKYGFPVAPEQNRSH
jgi:transposase